MKKKSNALVYILLFLITICLAGGIVGLMAKKSGINNNTNSKKRPERLQSNLQILFRW